ncbi:MAG: zinc ribbon domain-containing protein [Clostridiales bacterium]|jgi:uncharacterized Zn finger protein (UPF0148 family)|nr:zinc ribbon domain-containing protein [Clostridiales bacterium]
MAIVAVKCSQCGSSIKIDAEKGTGVCPYCGTMHIKDNAERAKNNNEANAADKTNSNAQKNTDVKKPLSKRQRKLIKKIAIITLIAIMLLGSVLAFHSDYADTVFRTYYLYTWNDSTLMRNKLFSIAISNHDTAILTMPMIYGDTDENGDPNPDAGQMVFDENGNIILTMAALSVAEDNKGRIVLFSFELVYVEETDTYEPYITFQMRCYRYKNYIIPDLNNPYIILAGDSGEWMYPQLFYIKDPNIRNPDKNYLTKKMGLYMSINYDFTEGVEDYYPITDDEIYYEQIYLEKNVVSEGIWYEGDTLHPYEPYGTYLFNNDFLTITGDNGMALKFLNFQGYMFPEKAKEYEIKMSMLTTTFFMYGDKGVLSDIPDVIKF